MGGINLGRVVLGGLAAGVVLNCVDFVVATYLLADEMQAMITRLRLDPVAAASITPWVIVDFVWGILIVFTYAAMRPRFGPGPKTALIAGLTLWFAITVVIYGFFAMGIFSSNAFYMNTIFAALGTSLGAVVGAWLYKE